MIDEMPDEDFIGMVAFLIESGFDESYEDDFNDNCEEFGGSFSGEMVNFECPKCKKISAYPVEIIDNIYEETQKEPQIDYYYCESHNAFSSHYKAPDGKIFESYL